MTSENYRLKREHSDLNKKINQNWNDIERMEALISKKAALQAILPENEPNNAPSVPSAPPAPPPDHDNRIAVEIHPQPSRAHSTTTISSIAGRKK